MKVRGLDGRQYTWRLVGHEVLGGDTRPRSAGHKLARELLKAAHPFEQVLEEVAVPGCPWTLYLDFVLPRRRLVVEVQGEQHRRFVMHFHGRPSRYVEQRRRDQAKRDWCAANNLTLVELHDDRTDDWGRELAAAFRPAEDGQGGGRGGGEEVGGD